ncbi:MAG: DUF3857 domain-containing protein [Chitinophagaceae bacterium]|nr:DUF3857 domain-containing protein [Chitinophagaceae bacterium]
MKQKVLLLIISVVCSWSFGLAQTGTTQAEKVDFTFGKITPEAFTLPADAIEKDAEAYILCDKGFSSFEGNSKGWFTLRFERKVRIKINHANGVSAADFQIPLYQSGSAVERLTGLKAMAFNIEAGKIVSTELTADQVFTDKYSNRLQYKKFSVPGAKAGSVVDVTYVIESDFLNSLQPWAFQGSYPCYWSEYEVAFPYFFNYVTLAQGYQEFYQRSSSEVRQHFNILVPSAQDVGSRSQMVREEANVQFTRWVMKNVPALREENFTTSLKNHIAKIEFQLKQYRFEGSQYQDVMGNWPAVVKAYTESGSFGADLYKNNGWLDDELETVVSKGASKLDNAKAIVNYLQQKYSCNAGGEFLTSNLKAVVKAKAGNVGDINLLLTAMLHHIGIKVHPVILSTRANGWSHEFYPLTDRFNYVIAKANIDGTTYLLDATEPGLPFGNLPPQCYNGHAREIAGEGPALYIRADSAKERKVTTLYMSNDDDGKWTGIVTGNLGVFESLRTRRSAKADGIATVAAQWKKRAPAECSMSDPKFEHLDSAAQLVKVQYNITPELDTDADLLYINPLMGEQYKENPFASATRRYPVEMPSTVDEMFVANIEVPAGYTVEEIPKSAKINLFDEDGFYEYIIHADANRIMLRSRLVIRKAEFPAEDYESLREFFSYVVKKQAESIVFRKKPKA